MHDILTQVYTDIKDYLVGKSIYSPTVVKSMPKTPKYPLVIVKEINNDYKSGTFGNMETVDALGYEIEIYATDKTKSGANVTNNEIARELELLVDFVMSNYYCMRRISARPTPNIDITIFRVIMRYSKNINSRGQLF